jgi:purine-binding chemotaxis protein CheW
MTLTNDSPRRQTSSHFVICRSQKWLCALPLEKVAETMRPLPIEMLPDIPPPVLGVSIIRAAAVPVVDMAMLTGAATSVSPRRYVSLRLGERRHVALAVEEVLGVRELDATSLEEIPPLLHGAAAEAISAILLLDGELLLVLQTARLIPESMWADIGAEVTDK